jgi:hypothetical protein
MQYAILIYESAEAFASRGEDDDRQRAYTGAWREYHKSLVDAGIYVGGQPLQASTSGTTVRVTASGRQIQDGPYANTKEQLGGFVLLELPSLDEALEWAAKCPAAKYGAVEVRPVASDVAENVTARKVA